MNIQRPKQSTHSNSTKFRLHISGLTPSISSNDLLSRFQTFGKVISLDGFGARDANGDMRKFAFVTVEGSVDGVRRCCNTLSGTVWKGCKLRIGEAKPDFRERILTENMPIQETNSNDNKVHPPPPKRRKLLRGCVGVHASDMSLVTSQNYTSRSGWTKTPMGRLVRTVKMRPARPLGDPIPVTVKDTRGLKKNGEKEKRIRKRNRKRDDVGLVRARRMVIDPLKWGSEYLSGVLLEGETVGTTLIIDSRKKAHNAEESGSRGDIGADSADVDMVDGKFSRSNKITTAQKNTQLAISSTKEKKADISLSPPPQNLLDDDATEVDLHATFEKEAKENLALLDSMFSQADEWGGEESLSDIDVDTLNKETRMKDMKGKRMEVDAGKDEIEIVPRSEPVGNTNAKSSSVKQKQSATPRSEERSSSAEPIEIDAPRISSPSTQDPATSAPAPIQSRTTLKDVFKPRPEDAGFSLFENLDIDLELDESITAAFQPSTQYDTSTHASAVTPNIEAPIPLAQAYHSAITLDPSKPLFFPSSLLDSSKENPEESFSNTNINPNTRFRKGKNQNQVKDIVEAFKERGWDPIEAKFFRTETEEQIRKRWQSVKVELTRTYKKRHREAVKSLRRRGGKV